ncbi:HupE/UreJ family protein [Shimia litoralis]|uniref:HupE/UreJ family protein n=1 Tax=Shimia litoralis TaxID=420403 RepID=A0A4U7N4A7_9RHOB|nr:HupE/UreJ family protein [Shimia litoralis]TKZ19364.1 HupE/UreJ family protein [Shimia litoralis]
MKWALCLVLACCVLLSPDRSAQAHALDPGYLQIENLSETTWRVFWRKPAVAGKPMAISAVLPANCQGPEQEAPRFDGIAWVAQWVVHCPKGLIGGIVEIRGLEATQTDVLLRIEDGDARIYTARLTPSATSFQVPEDASWGQVFASYLGLGFEHILGGTDHLLFVFALLLLVPTTTRLIGAITAFTVAHSITLALASLGYLSVPPPPVEAVIALSIVLLAVEILRHQEGKPTLTQLYPWIVSFVFGLLHGLGFAGALSEIGLPQGDIPLALLAFNLGVEAGQIAFVCGVVLIFWVIRRVAPKLADISKHPGSIGMNTAGYAIGAVSTYWLVERIAAF